MSPAASMLTRHPIGVGAYSGNRQALLVGTMLLVWLVATVDKMVVFLLIDMIRADLAVSDLQISLLLSTVFAVAYSIGGLPFGYLADRTNRVRQILFFLVCWSAFSAASGLFTSIAALIVCRALVGFAEAGFPPARDSLVADALPADKLGKANAIMTSGGVIGAGLALVLGGLVTGLAGSGNTQVLGMSLRPWQVVFLITGASGFLLVPLLLLLPEPARLERRDLGAEPTPGFGALLRSKWRFYLGAFGATGMLSAVTNGLTAWTPAYLHREFGLTMLQAGSTIGGVQIVAIIASFAIAGWGVDRLFKRGHRNAHLLWSLAGAAIGGAVWVAAFLLAGPIWFVALYGAAYVIQAGYVVALVAVLQVRTPSEFRGRIAALFYLVVNIVGFGVGPVAVATVTDLVLGSSNLLGRAEAIVTVAGTLAALLFLVLAIRGSSLGSESAQHS